MTLLTAHETAQMRAAYGQGCDDARANLKPRKASAFTGQPGRNLRNYQAGYLHTKLDIREESRI